jgi:hypothetical protein
MLVKLTLVVNFTNILRAAFAPVDVHWSFWLTVWSIRHNVGHKL